MVVALLAEGVDRNVDPARPDQRFRVALLAEGVDRNILEALSRREGGVALLAEGVDRNGEDMTIDEIAAGRPPRGGRG